MQNWEKYKGLFLILKASSDHNNRNTNKHHQSYVMVTFFEWHVEITCMSSPRLYKHNYHIFMNMDFKEMIKRINMYFYCLPCA